MQSKIRLPDYLEGVSPKDELKRAINAQADLLLQILEILGSHKAVIDEHDDMFKVHGERIKKIETAQGKKPHGPAAVQDLPQAPETKAEASAETKDGDQKGGTASVSKA